MAKDIMFSMTAKNIGPHINTSYSGSTSALQIGLYSGNGEGKTFLSRVFRLAEDQTLITSDSTKKLLSQNTGNGEFLFSTTQNDEEKKELKISIQLGQPPKVENNSGYIFHVFNSDYVLKNLAENRYSPSGEFEGYIIGESNIDLAEDKKALAEIKKVGQDLRHDLQSKINEAKNELLELKIHSRTVELAQFDIDNVLDKKHNSEKEDYDTILLQYIKMDKMPDDIPDILMPDSGANYSFFANIKDLLATPYARAHFADDFLEHVRVRRNFVESGLQILHSEDSVCPFCDQKLGEDARNLISKYERYLADEESKIVAKIETYKKDCESAINAFASQLLELTKTQNEFESVKKYFDTYSDVTFPKLPDKEQFSRNMRALQDLLVNKSMDISSTTHEATTIISNIEQLVSAQMNLRQALEVKVVEINKDKNNIREVKLAFRRKLCNARYEKLLSDLDTHIQTVLNKRLEYTQAGDALKKKQKGVKTSKRELVANTFTDLLDNFFGSKYSLNIDKFCLIFNRHDLHETASDILSDGEKSIIAFCFYLATTHALVNSETEYDNIFFVIDDPISSMDFMYVYTVAQAIRSLKLLFPKINKQKFLIFTHNSEFMSIIHRNDMLKLTLSLRVGKIDKLKRELIVPYESHLSDIISVANGATASHTTGNSIRHVLETIWRFEHPEIRSFRDYFSSINDLQSNAFLYSLTSDLSHGAVRIEPPFSAEIIQRGCVSVVAFIRGKYAGQVACIEGN